MKFPFPEKSNPGIPFLIALVLCLLFFFGFSLARRLAAPPSEGISREIVSGELDYGFSRTVNCHTHLLELPGRDDVTVFAVDGKGIRLIDLNIEGEILKDRRLDLDLSQSSRIEASYSDPENIRIFYMKKGLLNRVDIPAEGTGYSESPLSSGVRSFSGDDGSILFLRDDGLFAWDAESLSPHRLPVAGEILSFKVMSEREDAFALVVTKADWDRADLHLLRWDEGFHLLDDASILRNAPLKFYGDLKDVYRSEGTLTALYSYRDKHDKLNTLTLQTIDLARGALKREIRSDFPYYNSRYTIVEAGEEGIRFLLQFDGRHSVDLGLCAMESDGSYTIRPLTRTRNVSKLTGLFNREGRDGLVFTDLEYEKRILHFASGTDRMMKDTTRLSSVSFFYPLLTTILVFLVSLVSGVLFLMAVMPLPFAASLVADRSLRIKGPVGFSLITAAAAIAHTGLQILITGNILNSRIDTSYIPAFAGRGPWITVILLLLALISYAVARKDMKGVEYGSRSLMAFYVRFAVYDYIVYVPLFLMYVFNAVLLSKI